MIRRGGEGERGRGEDFTQVNVADQYNLVVSNNAKLSSLIATDGRGELIRIESEQLTKAQGLESEDVELWRVIEQRLDDRTERAALTDSLSQINSLNQ